MIETKKTLHQRVSSLLKNPKRTVGVVKEASIVPPSHYLKGKAVGATERIIANMKKPVGLNGVVPVPGASKYFKEASEPVKAKLQKVAGQEATGAALGAGLVAGSTAAKINEGKRILERGAVARGGVLNKAHFALLAKKKVKNSLPGLAAATLAGAAAGHFLQKKASIASTGNRAGRAVEAFKALDKVKPAFESKHLKERAKSALKKAALPGAIVAGGVAVTAKNNQMKKEASELVIKDGKKYRKGTVGSAATTVGTINGVSHVISKGGLKGVAKSVANGALLGAGYGTVRGANRIRKGEISLDHREHEKLVKKASELLIHDGKKYRKGTDGSATAMMAGINGGSAAGLALNQVRRYRWAGMEVPAKALTKQVALSTAIGAGTGYLYSKVRGIGRDHRGETSLSPDRFQELKKVVKSGKDKILRRD